MYGTPRPTKCEGHNDHEILSGKIADIMLPDFRAGAQKQTFPKETKKALQEREERANLPARERFNTTNDPYPEQLTLIPRSDPQKTMAQSTAWRKR